MNASSVSVRSRSKEDQLQRKLHYLAHWNCYNCPTTWYRFPTESSLASLSPAFGRGRDSSLGMVRIESSWVSISFESLKIDRKTCAKFKPYWKLLKSMIDVVILQVFWSICLFSWFCWCIMAPVMFQRTLPSWRIHQATWHLQSLYSDSFSGNGDPLSSTSIMSWW